MKNLISKLTNTKIVIALAGFIVSLIVQFGFDIDSKAILGIVNTACSMLMLLGIMTKGGQETPKWNK